MTPNASPNRPIGLNTPVGEFLNAAAAKQPTPGGGSVTALVGALSASMGEMVVNYSVGKKGLEPHQPQLTLALTELKKARQFLLALMVEDQNAYALLTQLQKLPRDSADPRIWQRFDQGA